jgi:CRP-like cAMP-binding protein
MERLFEKFDQIKPLSSELKAYILSILTRKTYRKKEIILQEGTTAKYIYFIEKGLVRSLKYKRGKERTGWFMKEGDFFVSVISFFSQIPSLETIEAMEDCIVYCISYEQLEKIYREFPDFNLHGRVILQYYYQLSEKRNDMREQPAIDRFEFLMDDQPELVGRIRDIDLASYLAMEPETFSVQKSKFAKRKRHKNS